MSTYRDMKCVAKIHVAGKKDGKVLEAVKDLHRLNPDSRNEWSDTKYDYVPFEIQFNTWRGVTVKIAKLPMNDKDKVPGILVK